MLVLFVGWGTFYVFVLFRFRKGANPKANYVGAKGKVAKRDQRDERREREHAPVDANLGPAGANPRNVPGVERQQRANADHADHESKCAAEQ